MTFFSKFKLIMSMWPSSKCVSILDKRNGLAIQSGAHSPQSPKWDASPSPPRSAKIRIFQSLIPVLVNYDYVLSYCFLYL